MNSVLQILQLVARRTAAVLVLALMASAWMITAEAAPQAFACDASSHCYAVAVNQNPNTNHGVYGLIIIHCLYQPNNGNQARAEVWDVDSGGNNWIEAGIISGVDYNGTYRDKNWLWADKRPGYNYSEHDTSVAANTNVQYQTEITFGGSNTWYIYGENSFVQYGTSTNNSANLVSDQAGTEYEGSSTSGIRDIGDVNNLERQGSSGVWFNWGSGAAPVVAGTGHYIPSNYYPSSSSESWSGPC